MANIDANRLFHHSTVTKAISRVKSPPAVLSQWLNMNLGGSNTNQVSGSIASWDIFDKNRALATGRARASGPAVITRQSAGQKVMTMHRSFEKLNLLEDEIFNKRPIGGSAGTVDPRGQKYVMKQEEFLGQRFKNMREFMVSRMFRGSFQLLQSGQDLIPVDSGGTYTVSYGMPAGNLSQLNMLAAGDIIGVSWATTATATPIANMYAISAAMEQLAGYPLRHVWMNSTRFVTLIKTTEVINLAGTAATPFEYVRRDGTQVNDEGIPTDYYEAVLRGAPNFIIHVCNSVLDVNGTITKTFPDNNVLFTPDLPNIGGEVCEMYEGSEIIKENVMDMGREAFGFNAWTTQTIDPAGRDLKALDIALPAAYKPDAWAYGTVVF